MHQVHMEYPAFLLKRKIENPGILSWCLFDGERLVLAAFESWESLNVVVAVYREEREVFSARYLYGGTSENNMGYGFVNGIEPLGNDYFTYSQERGREIYIQDEKGTKKPLSLKWK